MNEAIRLKGVHRFRHIAIPTLNVRTAFTCFVCTRQIADGRHGYEEHLRHHRPTVYEIALIDGADLRTPFNKLWDDDTETLVTRGEIIAIRNLLRNSSCLADEPAVFLFKEKLVQTGGQCQLALKLCSGTVENDFLEIQTSNLKASGCRLGVVHVFNTRTNVVLNFDEIVDLAPGATHRIALAHNAIGICEFNTFLVAYSLDDCKLHWEYHRLHNKCCGNTKRSKFPPTELTKMLKEPSNRELYNILKRNHIKLKEHELRYFKSPSFRLMEANYTRTLRVCSTLDYFEKQRVLDTYRLSVKFQPKDLSCGKTIKIKPFTTAQQHVRTFGHSPRDLDVRDEMPCLDTYDSVVLQPPNGNSIETPIVDIKHDGVVINCPHIKPGICYTVSFKLCGFTHDLENWAICRVDIHQLYDYFFRKRKVALAPTSQLKFHNADIGGNAQQSQAVRQIAARRSPSPPYLLFGPPGTGKTQTLIEAVYQVLAGQPQARILLCTNSNAAADELMLRLRRIFYNTCPFQHSVYRLFSDKRRLGAAGTAATKAVAPSIDGAMVSCSNYCRNTPLPNEVLAKYRVVVCTLLMAGVLDLRGGAAGFTHVMVDECGSATESATLVAILCGLKGSSITANVVLAGDPKQLGPVIMSQDAIKIGYDKSMLERLLATHTPPYDPHHVTKLLRNYRSHAAIIEPSNRLFYDGQLHAVGPPERINRFLHSPPLRNASIPVLFHAMINTTARQENHISWHNPCELDRIVEYVALLLKTIARQHDIAVITPYRKQCEKFAECFAALGWTSIAVSTVEMFQGKERPIVLISTVRSGRQGIGFLRNAKRLNVMLTRAQALMIVVGNPRVLAADEHWIGVLAQWKRDGVCVGEAF